MSSSMTTLKIPSQRNKKIIDDFQSGYPNEQQFSGLNFRTWEALGDGFKLRGSFVAASKAFEKAISLNEAQTNVSMTCIYQTSN